MATCYGCEHWICPASFPRALSELRFLLLVHLSLTDIEQRRSVTHEVATVRLTARVTDSRFLVLDKAPLES